MVYGKSWAILAAVAAVAFGNAARAQSVSSAASPESLTLSRPVAAQAASGGDKALMEGLNQVGLAQPLKDNRIDIGGYVASSTTYYLDTTTEKQQPGRGFDFESQDPTLNQLGLYIARNVDTAFEKGEFDIGGRIEWIYGADARFIHSTGTMDYQGIDDGPNNQFDPVQAFIDTVLPIGTGLKLRTGKFVTGAGYETINPTTGPFYSRGLIFTFLLPFTHTGVTGAYNINKDWNFEGGIIRGWDDALEDKNNAPSIYTRSSHSFSDGKTDLFITGIFGPEFPDNSGDWRHLLDVVLTTQYSDNWSFAVEVTGLFESDQDGNGGNGPNLNSNASGFAGGLGGWANYTYSKHVTIHGRLEYLYDGSGMRLSPATFSDSDGDGTDDTRTGGESNNVYSAALGTTIKLFPTDKLGANFSIRPEMRYDYAENSIFGGDNNQLTFALSGVFEF